MKTYADQAAVKEFIKWMNKRGYFIGEWIDGDEYADQGSIGMYDPTDIYKDWKEDDEF